MQLRQLGIIFVDLPYIDLIQLYIRYVWITRRRTIKWKNKKMFRLAYLHM